jgi:hypothetical protein
MVEDYEEFFCWTAVGPPFHVSPVTPEVAKGNRDVLSIQLENENNFFFDKYDNHILILPSITLSPMRQNGYHEYDDACNGHCVKWYQCAVEWRKM